MYVVFCWFFSNIDFLIECFYVIGDRLIGMVFFKVVFFM